MDDCQEPSGNQDTENQPVCTVRPVLHVPWENGLGCWRKEANLQEAAQPPPRRRAKGQGPLLW